MTVREAAKRLELSTSEVYALCRARLLRHCRFGIGRGKIMIQEADLELYRQSCVVEPVDQRRPREKARSRRQVGRPLLLPSDVRAALRAEGKDPQ